MLLPQLLQNLAPFIRLLFIAATTTVFPLFFIPQISDQKTNHETMQILKKLIKELRRKIVNYFFPFLLLVKI